MTFYVFTNIILLVTGLSYHQNGLYQFGDHAAVFLGVDQENPMRVCSFSGDESLYRIGRMQLPVRALSTGLPCRVWASILFWCADQRLLENPEMWRELWGVRQHFWRWLENQGR